MHTTKIDKKIAIRKHYQRPALKNLGSVRQLTLKLGSLTDGGQAGNFQ